MEGSGDGGLDLQAELGHRVSCPSLSALLVKHTEHALGIERLPTLIEMTSLGEGGCDLA